MEKTYNDCGLGAEEVVEIMTDVVREIASRIDLKDVAVKVKEKHPTVNEEQWDKLMTDNQDIPDIRDMNVLNGFLEEMNFKELLMNSIQLTLEDNSGDEPEKLEE
jgi:hypothetical protein